MALPAHRRVVMTLFSAPLCPYSHRTRIVLAEKGISVDVVSIDLDNKPEDLIDINPYNSVPTLVDRDLVLYDSRVIMEYLDERFPHPSLMPVDPVSRAKARLVLYRIDRDWYRLLDELDGGDKRRVEQARKELRDSVAASADVFAARPYFLSDDFSLADCSVAAVLWRLPHHGIRLPAQARAVMDYAERIFDRDSFRASLSDDESAMRDQV